MRKVRRSLGKFARKNDVDAEEKEVPVIEVEALKAHHEWKPIWSPRKSPRKPKKRTSKPTKSAKKTLALNSNFNPTRTPRPKQQGTSPGKGRKSTAKEQAKKTALNEAAKIDFSQIIIDTGQDSNNVHVRSVEQTTEQAEEEEFTIADLEPLLRRSARISTAPRTNIYGAIEYDHSKLPTFDVL